MKPPGRMWQSMKWTGAVVTVLLLVVWVGSAWYGCRYSGQSSSGALTQAIIGRGEFTVVWKSPWQLERIIACRWWFDRLPADSLPSPGFDWWFRVLDGGPANRNYKAVRAPLWFPLLLTGVPTVLMFRRDRRRRRAEMRNLCPHCGYSRTGLPADHACPECGKAAGG